MAKRDRTYSPYTRDAARLLGARVRTARRARRWSERDLAERVGVSRPTLRKVERGDPTVGLGVAFDAAALVGVPLFHADADRLTLDADRAEAGAALLPRRVRVRDADVKDDF